MKNRLTLGSLFDGSGGFPLGGLLAGIVPLWSSEIEPFPIRVTEKWLPFVEHYGDINKLNGAELPPVDIITFGSPCQDMSIAGKRSGIGGERSSLFFEAIRIIKEMRCATNGKYPRYCVWENVLGAFSSNKGEDFRQVLREMCRVRYTEADVPKPEKRGSSSVWAKAGEIVGDGFSVAWRVLDARYWGVPQRRKRIFLVADYNSECAGEILFKSEGVSAYSADGFRAWQRAAADIESSSRVAGAAGFCTEGSAGARGIGYEDEICPTLRAGAIPAALVFENHSQDARVSGPLATAPTVSAKYGTGGNNQPLVLNCFDVRFTSEGTKNARANVYETDTSRTIDCSGNTPDRNQGGLTVVYGIDRAAFNQGKNALYNFAVEPETEPTIVAKGPGAVAVPTYSMSRESFFTRVSEECAYTLTATDYKSPPIINNAGIDYIVRRLCPTECARLQGFPDWWCADLGTDAPTLGEIERWREIFTEYGAAIGKNIKRKTDKQIIKWLKNPHSDSAEYKLWGNGVALPCVYFVLAGIVWHNSHNPPRECLYNNCIDIPP